MMQRSKHERACIAGIFSGFLIVGLLALGMVFYAGGSLFNVNAQYFDFFANWFSDLGRVAGYAGQDTTISSIFMNLACFLPAICVYWFFLTLPAILGGYPNERRWIVAASICGGISAGFVAGIPLAPLDINGIVHSLVSGSAYISFGIAAVCVARATWTMKVYPRAIMWGGLAVAILNWSYNLILPFVGTASPETLMFNVIFQRVMEGTLCTWITSFAWMTLRRVRSGILKPNLLTT